MEEPSDHLEQFGDLRTSFVFVPHGDPEPLEWMAAHPGWVKFPAVMVPRASPAAERHRPPVAPLPMEDRRPGMAWAFARRPVPPDLVAPDPHDPMNPSFDPVVALRRVGYLADPEPGLVEAQWWAPLLESPLSKPPEGLLPRLMERIPRLSGK